MSKPPVIGKVDLSAIGPACQRIRKEAGDQDRIAGYGSHYNKGNQYDGGLKAGHALLAF
jgi:hypothetical protein